LAPQGGRQIALLNGFERRRLENPYVIAPTPPMAWSSENLSRLGMRLLVTGSDGFVGSVLSRHSPCVPLADSDGSIDLRDADRLRRVVRQIVPDAVIHLAAQSFVPASFAHPLETYEINFLGTFNLLQALKSAGFKGRLLFVGSADGYGVVSPDTLPIDEAHPLRPRSPYAVSKVAAEALCYQWSQVEGFEIVMTRSFNHIGPGQSGRFVVSDFARQVIEIRKGFRQPLISTGDIDVTRDFTDVRDVVEAYLLLLERGRAGEVYNVCSGSEYSVRDVLDRLIRFAGVEATVERDPSRLRRAEQRRMCGSPRKLERDTGWTRRFALDQSLKDVLDDWEAKLS
jgi:GDP-4-dehydro-6-deoxy-D-mannose reductase